MLILWCNVCVCVCTEAGPVVFIVSVVVGVLLLLVLVIGSLMCCIKKKQPAKRYRSKSHYVNSLCPLSHTTTFSFFILSPL